MNDVSLVGGGAVTPPGDGPADPGKLSPLALGQGCADAGRSDRRGRDA